MARKPAKMYRQIKGQAFTRREYSGGVPNNRILRYHLGNRKRAEADEFEITLELTADNACQIRDTALEAANRLLIQPFVQLQDLWVMHLECILFLIKYLRK